ncbi:MAG TPA: dihydrodipicolinate synthase family protein [Pseudonocardia sp.]|nr:dihydrodipicolinate synthase family protein [Pseudonocardia sp.]
MTGAKPVFTGVGAALVTLFDDYGDVDVTATARLAARLVELGVRAVVVAGTTGEADALDDAERLRLFEAVRAAVPASAPAVVVAGTGAPSTRQARALTSAAVTCGVDAVIARSPRGVADPTGYYAGVADAAGGVPVLAYHYPAVAPPGIPLEVLPALPVQGCKDSSADPDRLLATLASWPGPLYVGSSALLLQAGALGAAGAILALANAEPEQCAAAFAGDAAAQRALAPAHLAAATGFPRGVKNLVAARFGVSAAVRMG